jgi:hypothetical protein
MLLEAYTQITQEVRPLLFGALFCLQSRPVPEVANLSFIDFNLRNGTMAGE